MAQEKDRRVRRALLIGIDKYPKLPQLDGCVNDVQLMRSVLRERFDFPAKNIKVLTNEDATRDAILNAMDNLVEETGKDDLVVIHYAGHGSQMTDREGDEASGLDNTIMPFDSEGWQGDNRDITDDEIHLRLLALGEKTPYTTLIVDACHSGSITRDTFGAKSRSFRADTRPVSELPPSPIPPAQRQSVREPGPSGWMPLADRYVLLAGCRDEEISYEYRPPEAQGKIAHGALTYFLCSELRLARAGTTYRDVFERVAAKVSAANDRQHPQLEGRIDREVFGVRDLEPMRFVRVTAREGDLVTLGAGAALGLTVGSVWSVYPQGTKRTEGAEPLGTIEITEVRATTSDGRITSENESDTIIADVRAVETVHAYGELRLRVQLSDAGNAGGTFSRLREQIAASPLLELVDDDEPAAARIYLLAPRTSAAPADPVPQPAPTWAVVTESGQLMMPPKPVAAFADVTRNLEKLARYRQALALDNPDPNSVLRHRVALALLRQQSDGSWIVAEPVPAGGQVVFEEGEAIAFRITNNHSAAVFVNLVDFGLSGSVSVVFPPRGATDKVDPEVSFDVGTRPGDPAFRLSMPKEFPYAADAPGGGAAVGVETLKLFVTTGQADFSFLAQQGVRSAGARVASPLMKLWQTAAGGAATRDISVSMPLDGDEDWATVVKPFVLRRRSSA